MNRFFLAFFSLLVLASNDPARAESGEKVYRKGHLSFRYPGKGWKLQELSSEDKQRSNVKLIAEGEPALSIIMSLQELEEKFTKEDLETRSVELAGAFALPIALSMANKKEENLTASVGSINIADGTELSYRYTVLQPGSNKNSNIEAFVYRDKDTPSSFVMGAILSDGSKLQTDLTAEYYDRFTTAYEIVESIALEEKE